MCVLTAGRPVGLAAVFEPRRVAVVGATDRIGTTGALVWHNLETFSGEVIPVSRVSATVAGQPTYPSLAAVEGDVDLAVLVVPAAEVPAVARDAAAKGVAALVVVSAGFAETGPEGADLQTALMAAAHAGGVRVLGPNCFGVANCDRGFNASLAAGVPLGGGRISLVTQSGAYGMAAQALGFDEHLRFAKVCATGNKADISDAELLEYLGDDPATATICFFLESLPDGRAFFDTARALTPRKPVIVAKTGRSTAGIRAAQSHTAGLAGSQRIWRAALDQAGVILTRSGLEMMDVARALDAQAAPRGRRVAVLTNSGGLGVELVDLLADEDVEVPELSARLQAELRPMLPAFASTRNPVDITPQWRRFAELYPALIERLARSGEVDAVVPVLVHRAAADENVAIAIGDAAARLVAEDSVPVYVCWAAPRAARPNADLLQRAGVPCFEWPERTARAIGHAVRYGVRRAIPSPASGTSWPPTGTPAFSVGWLGNDVAAEVLATARIPTIRSRICTTLDDVEVAAHEFGYPVVAKVLHPSLIHKSEVGGVRTGLDGPVAVQRAATELLSLASGAQVLIQPHAHGTEIIVGGLRDEQFGPAVMVGLGGVFVHDIDDVVFGLAPLHTDEALRLLRGLRGFGRLGDIDLDVVSRVMCRVGELLIAIPEIDEIDLNPLLAGSDGCVAVDWRIRARAPHRPGGTCDDACH